MGTTRHARVVSSDKSHVTYLFLNIQGDHNNIDHNIVRYSNNSITNRIYKNYMKIVMALKN